MFQEILKNTFNTLLEGKEIEYYISGFIITAIGVLFALYVKSKKRDPESPNTPTKFSWRFLIWDNTKKVVVILLLIFLLFRAFDLTDTWKQISVGMIVPWFFDQILFFLEERSSIICELLGMDRKKYMKKVKK